METKKDGVKRLQVDTTTSDRNDLKELKKFFRTNSTTEAFRKCVRFVTYLTSQVNDGWVVSLTRTVNAKEEKITLPKILVL